MVRALLVGIAVLAALGRGTVARAQSATTPETLVDEDADVTEESRGEDDPTFGPVLAIEGIEVHGNASTSTRIIVRALPIKPGDVLRAGDPRLRTARFKLLALGFFRKVELSLRKGSKRGSVILTVVVSERGTVILNRLNFGSSLMTPWWAGLDLSERNFLGTGLGIGGGFVYAADSDIIGARSQWAAEARIDDPSVFGTKFGWHAGLLRTKASQPFRIGGSASDNDNDNFNAFHYVRTGFKGGLSIDVTPLSRVVVDTRIERVRATLPEAPTRTYPDGSVRRVDLGMLPGTSRLVTLSLSFDRDTRADPVLPFNGDHVAVFGELGASWMGGSYDYGTLLARYEKWWPLRSVQHVLSVHLTGGLVLGDAPLFDQLHAADFNRMLTPRVLGMVVSTQPSRDFLGTNTEDVTYGQVGGAVEVQYTYRLFRRRRHVYGGDLFIGAGLWSVARTEALRVRDESLYRALPVDVFFDAGLRVDTEIGIFELTFANALGRVPL
jgi:hypothetical protein